jgi:predicted O-methyltransferase YrrM
MQRINSDLKTLVWYSKRPRLYPELFRSIGAKYLLRKNDMSETSYQAVRWCQEQAVTTAEAVKVLTGMTDFESVRDGFSSVFTVAEETAQRCPVKMGGPGNLDLLYWISEYLKAKYVIETGVAYGWSSLAILLSLQNRADASLVSTDMPYLKADNDRYVGCVVPMELKSNWQIIDRADREALPIALKKLPSIDMCHYDSDKSYDGRIWAYPSLWKALRPGGIFISDDIGDNRAFYDFCNQVNQVPVIVGSISEVETKYVGVLVKTAD